MAELDFSKCLVFISTSKNHTKRCWTLLQAAESFPAKLGHRVVFWETNGQQKDLLLSTKCKGQIHLDVIIQLRRLIMVLQVDLRLLMSNF